jgi:hypothetical protein
MALNIVVSGMRRLANALKYSIVKVEAAWQKLLLHQKDPTNNFRPTNSSKACPPPDCEYAAEEKLCVLSSEGELQRYDMNCCPRTVCVTLSIAHAKGRPSVFATTIRFPYTIKVGIDVVDEKISFPSFSVPDLCVRKHYRT